MHSTRIHLLAALAIGLAVSSVHAQQLPVPRLNSIFPCGARQGTSVDCVVAGGELQGATGLYFSHAGITAQAVGPNKFKVSVARDVPVGQYDVRVVSPLGLSNFRAFVVSDWPEVVEKEPNNEPASAQRVSLPVVVNGRMDGGTDIDHYVFTAKKGERILINCWAWRIDSQMDGTLMLFDAKGKELAYNGDYYGKDPFLDFTVPADGDYTLKVWDFVYGGGNDYFYRLQIGALPHIDAVIPAAVRPGAKTTVTLFGRNLPGGKPAPDGAQIQGRPLEVITREIEAPADPVGARSLSGVAAIRPGQSSLDGMAYRLATPDGSSNPIFLGFTTDPILVEKEPNNDLKSAQRVPVPCDITGTFAPVGDLDFFAFSAKKGEKLVIETIGDRQAGLVNPFLAGFNSAGKKLISVYDSGRNVGQLRFTTTTRDARWDFVAPADGEYLVQVRDLYYQQRGDPRFTYRLSIRRPQPDFRLVVVPASETQPDCAVVGQGGHQWMDVLVFRNDGFEEPIRIEADQLPAGVTCEPVVIGPGKTSAPLVFRAAKDAPAGHAGIRVIGKSKIGETELVRVARAGGLTWPTVNTPGVARLADSLVLAVRAAPPFALTATPGKTQLAAGDKLPITVKIERASDWTDAIQLSGYDLPAGAAVGLVTVPKGATEGKVELTLPKNLRPGTYTFILSGAGQVGREYASQRNPLQPRGANIRVVFPSNAITITVGE
jgi:hypothetical protein